MIRQFDCPRGRPCVYVSFGDVHDEASALCREEQLQVLKLISVSNIRPGELQNISGRCISLRPKLYHFLLSQVYGQS